jgi:hypothetical protein
MAAKLKMICAHCGSEKVRRDAYAKWNIAIQAWELAEICESAICTSVRCDRGETRVAEEPILPRPPRRKIMDENGDKIERVLTRAGFIIVRLS